MPDNVPKGWLESFEDDDPAGWTTFHDRQILQTRQAKPYNGEFSVPEDAEQAEPLPIAHSISTGASANARD